MASVSKRETRELTRMGSATAEALLTSDKPVDVDEQDEAYNFPEETAERHYPYPATRSCPRLALFVTAFARTVREMRGDD